MSVDAGTIYASIRVKLDGLNSDLNQAVGKLDGFTKKLSGLGSNVQNLDKFGKDLSLKVTAPIVIAGAAMVKFASDQAESLNAANVVFGKSANTITDWGEKAAKQAGLAKSEFYQAAAVIGAGFKNAGFSLDDAANQTINLTKRAADMASIFNTDVNDAMTALQSALRGEYEPARRFAVTLSEATVSAEAMSMGISKTGKDLSNYEKTQARLSLIMKQTAQFQGDFVNTSDQLANSTRILQAELKNEAAELGKQLLPAILEIVKGARGLVENFSKLDDGTKKTILVIAGFAAATGPVILGITNTIKAIEALKTAMLVLAANPIGLAVAGVAALTAGLIALGEANQQKMVEDVEDRFKVIGELAGVASEKIVQIEEAMANYSKGSASAEEMQKSIEQIAKDTGLTKEQVIAIGVQSNKVTDEFRKQLITIRDIKNDTSKEAVNLKESLSYVVGTTEWVEAQKKLQEKITLEAKAQNTLSEEAKKQIEGRIKAEEAYQQSIRITEQKVKDKLITESEGQKEIADAQSTYLDTLYELGYAYESEIGTKGRAAYEKMLAAVKAYNESQKTQNETFEYYKTLLESINELDVDHRMNALAGVKEQIEASDMDIEKKKEILKLLQATTDATIKATQENDKFAKASGAGLSYLVNGFSALGEAMATGSLGWDDFAKLGLNAIATMIEALGQEILAATAANFVLQGGILNPAAWANAASGAAQSAIAFTAAGVVKGFAGSFENGGIVPGNSYTGDRLIARVNSGEEVITRDDPRNVLNGGGQMSFVFEMDGEVFARASANYYNNGQVRLKLK